MIARRIAAYHHTPPVTQQPDSAPGPYYVSVRDGERVGLLAGPFATHAEALAMLPRAKAAAHEANTRAVWYAYGTVRMAEGYSRPGVLNALLGLSACKELCDEA